MPRLRREARHPAWTPAPPAAAAVRSAWSPNTPFGRIQNIRTCSRCHGTGKIINEPCAKCKGRGKVRVSKRRTVKIPAGIDNGQVLTIRGQGGAGRARRRPRAT